MKILKLNFQVLYTVSQSSLLRNLSENFYNTKLKFIINRFGVIAGPWQFGKEEQGFVPLWIAKHYFKRNFPTLGLVVAAIKLEI